VFFSKLEEIRYRETGIHSESRGAGDAVQSCILRTYCDAIPFIFALYHIPVQLSNGVSPLQLPLALLPIWLIGLLLAVVYLRTGNLFLVVGLHALNDSPTILFSPTFLSNDLLGLIIVFVFALLLLLFWPLFTKRRLQPQHAYGG